MVLHNIILSLQRFTFFKTLFVYMHFCLFLCKSKDYRHISSIKILALVRVQLHVIVSNSTQVSTNSMTVYDISLSIERFLKCF